MLADVGYGFGSGFRQLMHIKSVTGQCASRAHVSLPPSPLTWSLQSAYALGPACTDACFQVSMPALWAGQRSAIAALLVPNAIDCLIINPTTTTTMTTTMPLRGKTGVAVARSHHDGSAQHGIGVAASYAASCTVYDGQSGAALLALDGLRSDKLDTGYDPLAQHTFSRAVWRPDIGFVTAELLRRLSAGATHDAVPDLVVVKFGMATLC
jgi:hypothetical protein